MSTPHPRTALIATFAAICSTMLGGSAAVATRFVLPESEFLTVTFLRNLGAATLIVALALATTGIRIKRADLPAVILLGLLQFGIMQILFVAAFQYVPAARGALVLSTMPVITLTLAALMRREQLTPFKIFGGLLAFTGVALALGDRTVASGPDVWKGDLLMFVAACCGALYSVMAGRSLLRRYPAVSVTAIQLPVGALFVFIVIVLHGDYSGFASLTIRGWTGIAYLMTLGGMVSFFLWVWALERTTPSRVAVTITLNPVAATLLGAVILHEPITAHVLMGLAVVVAGIALVNWPVRRVAVATDP